MCQQSIKNMNTDYKVGDFIYNTSVKIYRAKS